MTMQIRLLPFGTAFFAMFAAAACGGSGYGNTPAPATATPAPQAAASPTLGAAGGSLITVQVEDNTFSPANLTVPAGAKVTWSWSGKNPHSVVGTWQGNAVESPQLRGQGSFEFTFKAAGTFAYQCGVHGAAMTGKVTVKP